MIGDSLGQNVLRLTFGNHYQYCPDSLWYPKTIMKPILKKEIEEWCQKTIGSYMMHHIDMCEDVIVFEKACDMVLFKIKWGNHD